MDHSSDLLDELDWENSEIKQLAVVMYKVHKNLCSLYFKRIYAIISSVHIRTGTQVYTISKAHNQII